MALLGPAGWSPHRLPPEVITISGPVDYGCIALDLTGLGMGTVGAWPQLRSPPSEPLSMGSSMSRSLGEPGEALDAPPSSEPGPRSFPPLDEPSALPLPRRPPALAEPALFPPATAAPEPGASPRLAVDLTLPEELPLVSSHEDTDGEPEETVGPPQVALSVAEFGLIGIGDVNPFLASHPACPAPGLHSEPLSQ